MGNSFWKGYIVGSWIGGIYKGSLSYRPRTMKARIALGGGISLVLLGSAYQHFFDKNVSKNKQAKFVQNYEQDLRYEEMLKEAPSAVFDKLSGLSFEKMKELSLKGEKVNIVAGAEGVGLETSFSAPDPNKRYLNQIQAKEAGIYSSDDLNNNAVLVTVKAKDPQTPDMDKFKSPEEDPNEKEKIAKIRGGVGDVQILVTSGKEKKYVALSQFYKTPEGKKFLKDVAAGKRSDERTDAERFIETGKSRKTTFFVLSTAAHIPGKTTVVGDGTPKKSYEEKIRADFNDTKQNRQFWVENRSADEIEKNVRDAAKEGNSLFQDAVQYGKELWNETFVDEKAKQENPVQKEPSVKEAPAKGDSEGALKSMGDLGCNSQDRQWGRTPGARAALLRSLTTVCGSEEKAVVAFAELPLSSQEGDTTPEVPNKGRVNRGKGKVPVV